MKKILLSIIFTLCTLANYAQPKVLSHRGFYTNPKTDENSLQALKQAQELHRTMGLAACEFDVHKTADGELIIYHNNETRKGLHCQRGKWADIKKETLPMGNKIPTLREWFAQAKKTPDFKIALELKTHATPQKETEVVHDIVQLAKEMDMMKQLMFLSFSIHACKEFIRQAPGSYVIYNSAKLFEEIDPDSAKALGLSAISYRVDVFLNNLKYIKRAKEIGIDTYLWMVEDEYLIDWATAHDVTWVTTDFTDRILEYTNNLAKDKKRLKRLKKKYY